MHGKGICVEITEYRKNAADMIALVRCAVSGETPDAALTGQLDLPKLFEVCQSHILTACAAYALESAGIRDAAFVEAKEKAIRKNILMDAERAKVLDRLEQEQIWYMPLKGAVLKDWYPRLGMRQMSDNDILCDGAARQRIRTIMEDMGFTCAHFETGNDDAYYKPPVCNFEMHNELFSAGQSARLHQYYQNVKARLLKEPGNAFGYRFSASDFYIYLAAHEYQHYVTGGTGVRCLPDTLLVRRKLEGELDWDYIGRETERLGIREFEQTIRNLSDKVFAGDPLSAEEQKELDYLVTSGIYGTKINEIANQMKKSGGSGLRYWKNRLFPPLDWIRTYYPFFGRHRWLIPGLWVWRPLRAVFCRRNSVQKELSELRKLKHTNRGN